MRNEELDKKLEEVYELVGESNLPVLILKGAVNEDEKGVLAMSGEYQDLVDNIVALMAVSASLKALLLDSVLNALQSSKEADFIEFQTYLREVIKERQDINNN